MSERQLLREVGDWITVSEKVGTERIRVSHDCIMPDGQTTVSIVSYVRVAILK